MTAVPQPGDAVAGFRLRRLLGQGTQSSVYLAEHVGSGGMVALKLVDLGAAATAVRETFLAHTAVARRLLHPGIVTIWDAGIEGRFGWLAMEPVPGASLVRCTRVSRLLPEPLLLHVAERLAEALAYAHRQGVVHRDIKPANILAHWPGDIVKLADFGLARATDAGQTATGLVLGSPGYMAPEQLAGGVPTAASDFYAFGATLFQLLTGRLPHEADSLGELLRRVATQPAPDPTSLRPGIPAPLAALVARLLARNVADRPTDGEALLAALREVRAAMPAEVGAKSR